MPPRQLCFAWPTGTRVGEATHPGPLASRTRALAALADIGIGSGDRGGPHAVPQTALDTPSSEPGPDQLSGGEQFEDCSESAVVGGMTPPSPTDASYPPAQSPVAVCPPTNSWFYVPLLLHVAGRLDAPSADVWSSHPVGGRRWGLLVDAIVAAPAIPVAGLLAAVHTVALVVDEAVGVDDVARVCAQLGATSGPTLDARDAVLALLVGGRYVPALGQSAILQAYGGARGASEAATLARVYAEDPLGPPRALGGAGGELADDHLLGDAAARVAGTERARGRGRRGRGRGRGRNGGPGRPPPCPQGGPGRPPPSTQLAPNASPAQSTSPAPLQGVANQEFWRTVDLAETLQQRVFTLQAPPHSLRGALRQTMRQGLELIRDGREAHAVDMGWKLFLLAPRMLLFRSRGQVHVPPRKPPRPAAMGRLAG